MLKIKTIALLLLMPLAIGLPVVYVSMRAQHMSQESYSMKISGKPEILVKCPLPTVISSVPILKVQCRDITEDMVKAVALELFNLTGNLSRPQYAEAYLMRNGSQIMWVSDSGGLWYDSGFDPNFLQPNLPNFTEARVLAEQFIAKVIYYRLNPQNPRITILFDEVAVGAQSLIPVNGTMVKVFHYVNVIFQLRFDNIKVGTAIVSLGEKGKVLSFQGFWRELQEVGSVQIIAPEEAVKELCTVGFGKALTNPRRAIIERMELCYFDDKGIQEHQDYLQPVYELRGVLIEETGFEAQFIQRIQAITA